VHRSCPLGFTPMACHLGVLQKLAKHVG
jgi:hypothetical protein